MAPFVGDIRRGDTLPNKWAQGVALALGLDPDRVHSMTLHFDAEDVVTVTVEMYVQDTDDFAVMPPEYKVFEVKR